MFGNPHRESHNEFLIKTREKLTTVRTSKTLPVESSRRSSSSDSDKNDPDVRRLKNKLLVSIFVFHIDLAHTQISLILV